MLQQKQQQEEVMMKQQRLKKQHKLQQRQTELDEVKQLQEAIKKEKHDKVMKR